MVDTFNSSQAKLLANFCSDLAKGLMLAGVSTPFISREALPVKGLLTLLNSVVAVGFLKIAVELLRGVKNG